MIRPAPSLRILFVSPSLRVPGILQSRFLDRIGGSTRIRNSVADALTDSSRGVTAKIRWLTSPKASLDADHVDEGRPRWIHCTPLLGLTGTVGVWMVVLVDDEKQPNSVRRFRPAPPVSNDLPRQQQPSYQQPQPQQYQRYQPNSPESANQRYQPNLSEAASQRHQPNSPEPASSGFNSDAEPDGRRSRSRSQYSGVYMGQHANGSIPRHIAEATRNNKAMNTNDRRAEPNRSKDSFAL